MRKEHFTVGELVKFTGLSPHMVNYLCRHELLVPTLSELRRRGVKRCFSYADLLLGRSIAKLLNAGVSVLALRKALQTLHGLIGEIPLTAFDTRKVAIGGDSVYLAEPGEPVVDLSSRGQLAFQFVLDAVDMPVGKLDLAGKRPRKVASR